MVVRLTSEFYFTGGPFWVVQEELIRQAMVACFEGIVNTWDMSKEKIAERIEKSVQENFPEALPDFITHSVTKQKIPLLKEHMRNLGLKISEAPYPQVFEHSLPSACLFIMAVVQALLLAYQNSYPCDRFIKWFIDWAFALLRARVTEFDTDILRFKVEFSSLHEERTIKEEHEDSKEIEKSSGKTEPPLEAVGQFIKSEGTIPSFFKEATTNANHNSKVTYLPWIQTRRLDLETLSSSSNTTYAELTLTPIMSPKYGSKSSDHVIVTTSKHKVGFCSDE